MESSIPVNRSGKASRDMSARSIVLILLYFILIGFFGLWANGVSVNTPGPNIISPDLNGGAYIQMGTRLYRVSPYGNIIDDYDLEELGIEKVFDIHFLDTDTILVRIGPFKRGLIDNIATFLRLPNSKSVSTDGKEGGLYKCSLQFKRCRRFSKFDVQDVHWLAYDEITGNVFISDSTRHQIHLLSADGKVIATKKDEFIFPNHINFRNETLTVVDTNHKKVKIVKHSRKGFGDLIKRIDPLSGAMRKTGHHWPYMMLAMDNEFWLIVMRSSMSHGGIYRYNLDWVYQGKLELPEDADPGYMARVGSEVWVSDYEGNRIFRFDQNGESQGELVSSGLEAEFEANRENRESYRQIADIFNWIFFISLVLGAIAGLWIERKRGSELEPENLETVEIDIKDPSIQWLQKNPRIKRYLYLVSFVIGLLVLFSGAQGVSYIAATTKEVSWLPILLPLLVLLLFASVVLVMFSRQGIGILNDLLIIRQGRNYKAARSKNILFSGSYIAIDGMILSLGSDAFKLYMMEDIVRYVNPIVSNATILERRDMGAYQIYNMARRIKHYASDVPAIAFWVVVIISALFGEFIVPAVTGLIWYVVIDKALLNGMVAVWVFNDAKKYDVDRDRRSLYAGYSILLTEFVVPVYLVKTRGWGGAFKSLIHFIGYFFVSLLVYVLVRVILLSLGLPFYG